MCGTFWAQGCDSFLAYLQVRCGTVLALHSKLHSHRKLLNGGNEMKLVRIIFVWFKYHLVFVVPLALLEREVLALAREAFSQEA